MNQKSLGIMGIVISVGIIAIFVYSMIPEEQSQSELNLLLEESEITRNKILNFSNAHLFPLEQNEIFYMYAYKDEMVVSPEGKIPTIMNFILVKELEKTYEEIGFFNEPQNSAVIIPTFTASAYHEPGFYNYFEGSCDETCLTVSLEDNTFGYTSSFNAIKILKLLQYKMITDVDVDKNPDILQNYEKIILLHNEYVTQKQFDAITNHPKVVYLYPNALYAEVESNYEDNTITLKRGHNYPESSIRNGFDWKHDNSPMEYNTDCNEWEFYRIDNGWMLNCYPEPSPLMNNQNFYKKIKEF